MEKAAREKGADLEAWETKLRSLVLAAGAKALAELIDGIGRGRRVEPLICCGAKMESTGLEGKTLLSILGEVPFLRSRYECPICRKVRYPGDEQLDVQKTTRTPGLRRMMARAGNRSTFKDGQDDLAVYAGIKVSAKDVERVAEGIGGDMERWAKKEREELVRREAPIRPLKTIPVMYVSYDGTGVPMVKAATKGRKGKQTDGTAKTREAKLGCVFTQTATDEEGFAIRDPDSTTFVGAIETAEQFGWRIYAEAIRRGLHNAERVVILGDGAEWIRNLAEMHFDGATQIIDLYHAREHVSDLCKILFGFDNNKIIRHRIRWWTDMDEGKIEKIVSQARKKLPDNSESKGKAEKEIAYLEKNKERMRYADYRADGLFVGSGVIEAGCKTVIGQRLKQSGMEWSVPGANSIISLRCMFLSDRLEDYWEYRCQA